MAEIVLKYIGKGAFLQDVPARDLTEDEVRAAGGEKKLLASGLYEKPKTTTKVIAPTGGKKVEAKE